MKTDCLPTLNVSIKIESWWIKKKLAECKSHK